MDIGQAIYDFFGSNGELGLVFCIFLLFLLDALLIPTLPELFFILAYIGGAKYGHPELFGVEILIAAILAEQVGIFSLYYVVKHVSIPKKIQGVADKYTKFLITSDEKLLLVNRVAPVLPFAGAFIAILGWNPRKSSLYIALGCIVKFGVILILSQFFFEFFSSGEAQIFTIIMILVVIGVSIACSTLLKKRKGLE
ncbi:MAG: hypothetical protein MJZ38_05055 [archaeon]|nr:hypothetical protein [archaeon]